MARDGSVELQPVGSTDDTVSNSLSENTEITDETCYTDAMSSHSKPRPNGWWRFCGRPIAAYCAASGAALGLVAVPFISEMTTSQALAGGLIFELMLSPYVAVFAFLPSMAALTVVKALRLRRGVTDMIAGGFIGALMITAIHQLGSSGLRLDRVDLFEFARFGVAGLVGGFTYWFVNGRPRSCRQPASLGRLVNPSIFD